MRKTIDIISDYEALRKKHPDQWLEDCQKATSLKDVIKMAATARNKENRKHPHQYRIKNEILLDFAQNVLSKEIEINQIQTFEHLYEIIEDCRIRGTAELTMYDTAHRIAKHLDIEVNKVYIHNGTKVGAEKYLGRKIKDRSLDKSHFPELHALSCEEIEDLFCLYKDDFGNSNCIGVKRIISTCS